MAKFTEEDWDMKERDDCEIEEMSRQVGEGYTSGHLDAEDGTSIYWELRYNKWKD